MMVYSQSLMLSVLILFSVNHDTISTSIVYHVLPSLSDPCPTQIQPCLTLSQFASNINNYLHPSTTLIFSPGNHSFDAIVKIEAIVSLQLTESNTVHPLHTSIVCEHSSSIDLYSMSFVCIRGLMFVGCSSFRGELIGQLLIEGTKFLGQATNNGSALELIRSNAVINRSCFISNQVGNLKALLVLNLQKGGYPIVYTGGAISLTKSNVEIRESSFILNGAEAGGAIFCERDSNITVVDSTFEQNHIISQNTHTDCYGGALYCQSGCSMNIYNTTFTNNTAIKKQHKFTLSLATYSGGAIAVVGAATVIISECKFRNNRVSSDGGVLYALGGIANFTAVYMNRSEFNTGVIEVISSRFGNNKAKNGGILSIANNYSVSVNKSEFISSSAVNNGGVIQMRNCVLNIEFCTLHHNKAYIGGTLYAAESTVIASSSNFGKNTASFGGAVYVTGCTLSIDQCEFTNNTVHTRGGAIDTLATAINISRSYFSSNKADLIGAIHVSKGTVIIYLSRFTHNSATFVGGVYTSDASQVNVSWCEFILNKGGDSGSSLDITAMFTDVKAQITECVFHNNLGGAIATSKVTTMISNCEVIENSAEIGVLYFYESNTIFSGNLTIRSNIGGLFLLHCDLNSTRASQIRFTNNSIPNPAHGATSRLIGGAITAFLSRISLYGVWTLTHNEAVIGGAILATESKWFVYGELLLANNTAIDSGGGAYSYQSELNCKNHSIIRLLDNSAVKKGGGIHAVSSLITVDISTGSSVHFIRNDAFRGGGICLENSAKLYVLKPTEKLHEFYYDYKYSDIYYPMLFCDNLATYGGAVYVTDETNSGTCDSPSYKLYSSLSECPIQVLALQYPMGRKFYVKRNTNTYFFNNQAHLSGSTIFGGLLDRCTVSPFSEAYSSFDSLIINGSTYLQTISTVTESDLHSVSSQPVQVRFCKNGQPDYDSRIFRVTTTKKGELFRVPIVALDHVNHIMNGTIHILLSSSLGGLGEDQSLQESKETCTNLTLSVFSPFDSAELILYANGPCKDAEMSVARIHIHFQPCTCPVGFEPDYTQKTTCMCSCDSKLSHFIIECYQKNKTLAREGNFWISYLNSPDNNTSAGYEYLTHPQCPLDYCHPSATKVYINLSEALGSDGQCTFNRSGILCGKCLPGFSLSLGNSHCIKCSRHWPLVCLAITISAILAGVLLVILLLVLNLTVAIGTINGIILYANIVHANISTFTEPNFVTIFIAWLNLEIGINTCFFEGMDMYWKTLLQLIFPAYVIFLVIMVIVISERSIRFARLIGRKNPVATLDTLILISYSKLIQTIIAALSFTILEYPNGNKKVVWLPDANIEYLSGKHAFLFTVALVILLGGVAYTALLFFWQWLMHYQHKLFFKWVGYHRLQLFIEPYHAPYTFKHRYWTGLLLSVRVILYLASALNVSGAPAVNLLVTGIVVFSLYVLKAALYGPVYRKLPVEFLETTCYVNIIVLSFASFYTLETKRHQIVVAYISGIVTIASLVMVLAYHIFTEVCSKTSLLKLKLRKKDLVNSNSEDEISLLNYQLAGSEHDLPPPAVPCTCIDAPQ